MSGNATHTPLDLTQGNYCSGRKPEDGRIDWSQGAQQIHNLIRGVAPPYPGAFADVQGKRLRLLRSRVEKTMRAQPGTPSLYAQGDRIFIDCADTRVLELLNLECEGKEVKAGTFATLFGGSRVAAG